MALLALACFHGSAVTAVHVDHGLRPGSDSEADVVELAAARFGASFSSVRVAVIDGPNLEARARAARHEALGSGMLFGHTADDQAETILLNLLRGSGLDGLAAMGTAGHPLLRLRRAETHELCALLELNTVHDPSNDSDRFRRNRVRHELLPLAAEISERDVVPILTRQAELFAAEAELLQALADSINPTDAKALAAAPLALARRAVRRWLTVGYPPDAATVERVMAVARGEANGTDVGGGRRVTRSHQRLSLTDG